jgi:hypothetical protein
MPLIAGEQVYYTLAAGDVDRSILEVDLSVGVMVILTLIHAVKNKNKAFVGLLVAMAHAVEQSSVRLGGTHCHKPGEWCNTSHHTFSLRDAYLDCLAVILLSLVGCLSRLLGSD